MKNRIVILNTTILTADGRYEMKTLGGINDAKQLCGQYDPTAWIGDNYEEPEILSAIGHESTAQIVSQLLGFEVPVNRINYTFQAGDVCLCFKLKGRPEEGKILTREQIEEIGYEWKVIRAI
jgi:hypothetical protein